MNKASQGPIGPVLVVIGILAMTVSVVVVGCSTVRMVVAAFDGASKDASTNVDYVTSIQSNTLPVSIIPK